MDNWLIELFISFAFFCNFTFLYLFVSIVIVDQVSNDIVPYKKRLRNGGEHRGMTGEQWEQHGNDGEWRERFCI